MKLPDTYEHSNCIQVANLLNISKIRSHTIGGLECHLRDKLSVFMHWADEYLAA
jgi:hypothetical protein